MAVDPLAIPANNIICSLTDPEGRSLGASLDLPQDAGPKELHLLVNTLLQNVSARVLNDIIGPGPVEQDETSCAMEIYLNDAA